MHLQDVAEKCDHDDHYAICYFNKSASSAFISLKRLNSETNIEICVELANDENNSHQSFATCFNASISNIFTVQVSFDNTFVSPLLSVSVLRQTRSVLHFQTSSTSSCGSGLTSNETLLQAVQESDFVRSKEDVTRGIDNFGDKTSDNSSDDSSNEDDNDEGETEVSCHREPHSHQSLENNPNYKSLSTAVNTSLTPQTTAGKMWEALTAKPFMSMNIMPPRPPAMYATNKGDHSISDSLKERGPILLDLTGGPNELVMAAYSTQSIPNLYPIVGLRKELPGIALPPPIPLDLPKINLSRKAKSITSHQQVVREKSVQTGSDLGTASGAAAVSSTNVQNPHTLISSHPQQNQLTSISLRMNFSDPASIISAAAVFLLAGDYGVMLKVLEILDKHLILPEDIDLAKEFGLGLAYYKNEHYRSAKSCFNALFEKSINYGSPGNQALASIYLGEIEMSWAKYKDAEKHFTLAVTYYSSDNVAEKFQQTIFTKSTVLRKKGQCHWRLIQMREAFNAFKMAKDEAEQVQQQTRGSTLKTAKEDELSALFELGNILQSIDDYEQSIEYYKKSLKLAGELGDRVSEGRAHGNLGNVMLRLDQKDKALDHLIMAFQVSARYESNPLAVGRAVSNLGNVYQAIGDLPKAKEYYETALGHAIYDNYLQDQGQAYGNIGNVYMLLKESVKAVHYYTETLCLSTNKDTKITGYHDRGCARFDVAECILQGKKPKELVTATTPNSVYGRLTIKLTDEVITTGPVQEIREPSTQSISEQRESSKSIEMLPKAIKGKTYDGVTNVEIAHLVEALPFLEAAISDLLEAIQSHEQTIQNVKGSHEALGLSLSLSESNSRSFYKIQEALVELRKLHHRLLELGVIDMADAEPQEFKDALVYGEQARARTLGELNLQKKRAVYSDLFSISTPLKIQYIYKTVELQKVPIVFLSYCVSKLLRWILVSVKDEVIMKCQSIDLKEEELENSSFELYIRYNLLQFLSKDEIYIFRQYAYEQESPFTVLHDVIGVKIIEGLKSVGFSEVTEFIVIPDTVTHLLPFCPLMNKDNWYFFGDKYRIRIVPSFLSLLVMSMTSNPVVEVPGDKSDFLIVGNPIIPPFMYDSTQWNLGRLPYAEKEAISVANIIGTVPVLREQATKQSVLYRLRSAKVIHLAIHGSASPNFLAFTSSFPVSKSGLAEKEHILIFPKEIEALNISSALVVLSSYDSARGKVKAEGVIGMARAFLSAGTHSVLVSLWRVPDENANIFMQYFYEFPINGLPSLEALQRSMQCLRCFLKYSHYAHWSGFQIIGKEVTFHNAYIPIQKMLGEISFFPRQHMKIIEESLLLFLIYVPAVNTNLTPQTSAGTSHIGLKHEGKMREAAAKPNSTVMGFMLPKSPAVYTSKGDHLIGDSYSLAERGPILLDVPNGRNELVLAAYFTQSIPKLYSIVVLCKELLGSALPPPSIPLDLPKIIFSRKMTITSHQQMVREQPIKTDHNLGTVQRVVSLQRPQSMAYGYQRRQQTPLSQSMDYFDPVDTVRGLDDESNSTSSSDDEISNNQTPALHQQVVRMQPNKTNFDLGVVAGLLTNTSVQLLRSNHPQQYQSPLNKSMDFSNPANIVNKAAGFLHAEDYGRMIRFLEIYKHSVLPEDIDMAKEFGLGLAHYKCLHYRAAKFCFNALFEKSTNYGSPGNQALASIYLGEIEMSQAKYKDAEKHFTLAMTYYSSDNVAEKFQETIFTKSTVLRKKGQCHRSLSQIKEAINAFKMAKEEAEQVQEQTRGSKLKMAKVDKLSSLFELGNILQSIGEYKQSLDYYEKSLKLAGELGDHVSVGRAHGNLGNAMLGLDQKDKEALHHLIMAFEISEKYEDNPLAVGRASYNLGNAYQAIGDLPKAKEHYKIALQYNIRGNDLGSQSYICDHIAYINRLLKEPAEAVYYYTKALRRSTDNNTKITRYHNRGCARFEVAECILQGEKPKELVTATTQDPTYGRLTITDPQETEPNSQPISKQEESIKTLPIIVDGKTYDGVTGVEKIQLVEALQFLEAAKSDFHEAIELHEQSVKNSKGSYEASSSRSFYKIQETLVELGKLHHQLSEPGVMGMVAAEPQEFKDALVYGEQARARTLGELFLQKKRAMYSDLSSISTPLKLQDIYKAVQLQKVPVVFLSYCLSKLLMWILVSVKDEVVMKCQSIDLKEEELENKSLELYLKDNLLQFVNDDKIHIFRRCSHEQESPFTVLYDLIAVKIIEGLKSVGFSEVTEFIVIPDSVTHLIPFSSLMNKHNSQCFGDKYRIRIVPSFLCLLVMSMTSNPVVEVPGDKNNFLVVGNLTVPPFMYDTKLWDLPQLPDAEKEAIDIASITGTVPVLREQATKQSVLYRLRSAKVIHLATHGSASAMFLAFTSSFPVSKSGLAEKEHILIFPKEIETLDISPALVVLSACNLARGQVKAEGIIGAFLLAGAHSVVAKLWRAPDESTKIFMQFFYRFLSNGLPSLEALQRSMQCLRCFLKYSNYVHWSGFHIFGKEITFHRNLHAHFPIQKILGEVSIFPRQQYVTIIEESLLGVKNKIFTDVQVCLFTMIYV